MKLKLKYTKNILIPEQFHSPKYYFNQEATSFLKTDKDISVGNIDNIQKINFFVGANNSGKSRFLRGLFNTNYINTEIYEEFAVSDIFDELNSHNVFADLDFDTIYQNQNLEKLRTKLKNVLYELGIEKKQGITSSHDLLVSYVDDKVKYTELVKSLKSILPNNNIIGVIGELTDFKNKVEKIVVELENWFQNYYSFKTYIPPLRSLLKTEELQKENLKNLAKTQYKLNTSDNDQIFSGLSLFETIHNLRNSRNSGDLRSFEKFLSKNFFNEVSVELIPDVVESQILLIKIGGEFHRSLSEIGDGIQAIILLLYPIFTAKPKSWFFIEEPEINLHPGLQRIFIETLLNSEYLNSKKLKYFFTTHSNHFLDLTIQSHEIAIFQFEKLKEEHHLVKSNVKPCSNVLDILGVQSSSVFLANTSIWVEGPTDRKYISQFLKKFFDLSGNKFFKQDIDFTFFEYAGSLIEHYIFEEDIDYSDKEIKEYINAFSSSSRIYLLADEDNAIGKKAIRDQKLKLLSEKNSNFNYSNTKVKEIENLLPPFLLKKFLVTQLVKKKLSKEVIAKIDFKQEDYERIGLGKFFQEILNEHGIPHYKFKSKKSETLETRYKKKLCNFVLEQDFSFSQLTEKNPNLKAIIKELYSFIKK